MQTPELLAQLSSFVAADRRAALAQLAESAGAPPAEKPWVNMHLHTFFSFNGEGWSPSRLAWESRQAGLHAAGIVDFDVLAGNAEWFAATDLLGVRAAAGFETRVYLAEMAEHEITSPGEPGVTYYMGFGFVQPPAAGSAAAARFQEFLEQSHRRNRDVLARINLKLGSGAIDYDHDVLPLTPAGNATERHMVRAYYDKAMANAGGDAARAARFWADVFGAKPEDVAGRIANTNGFLDWLRSKLMKRGGPGYVQPSRDTFPAIEPVIRLILDCGAIPMHTWLDGASSGEKDPARLLECVVAKGSEAVNIVPDRNWNFKDPQERAAKVASLYAFVQAARALDLPINVGTELNKAGQRFVDDFAAPELQPVAADFLFGAQVMVGHTRLLRFAEFAYTGAAAKAEFPARRDRNRFFARVGALPAPDTATRERLAAAGPATALSRLRDAAYIGRWPR